MKKLIVVAVFLLIPALSVAAATISTGDGKLDKYLNGLNAKVASGTLNVDDLKTHIQKSFGLKKSDHALMKKKGLSPAEHYLVGLIHKATKTSASRIVRLSRGGKTKWSDVIYFLGATPKELNAERIADTRKWKPGKVGRKARASAKGSKGAAPATGQKGMTIKDDGKVWDCKCRLTSRRRK